MHLKGKIFLIWLMIFCLLAGTNVQAEGTEEGMTFYEEGDIVGFIGDSITHASYASLNYIEALYHYYLSCFPEQQVEFRNLGVPGYTIRNVLELYPEDLAFQGINKAVIMLGMNEALQGVSARDYIDDMEELIDRLKMDGLKGEDILVLSPAPYDQTCALNYDQNGFPYGTEDDLLEEYTEHLAMKVGEWGVNYLDLHTPMAELSREIQKADQKNTLTIGDCIHPNTTGQMIIAYHILRAQGADGPISEIRIPKEGEVQTVRGTVTDFYRGEKGICWTWEPETLPVPMTDEFRQFLLDFPPSKELYQEPLRIEGLSKDTVYTLRTEDVELGNFTGRELAEGVDLATLETNPLQIIVQQIEVRNREWHQESAKYRDLCYLATIEEDVSVMEHLRADFAEWKFRDAELRNEMYAIAQGAVTDTFHMTVTEEGASVSELEKEAKEAKKRAEEEAERKAAEEAKEQAAKKEAEEAAREAEEQEEQVEVERKTSQNKLFASAFGILAVVVVFVSFFAVRRKKR